MSQGLLYKKFLLVVRRFVSLKNDSVSEMEIIESIKRNVEFRGPSLWILVIAIILASIGLNVNSTAVIIGAMLISPLMGPIMGIGLGLGIYDFQLIKKAVLNLTTALILSILTSFFYFSLSPLSEAQSELLSRVTPTIWDVFIALFGGLAGIVALTSKEKGNVVPGVAIATALMPPLCTAGFGIAIGDFSFFLGAIYLFFINSVFICLATFLLVRLLKFKPHVFVDKKTEIKIKRYVVIIIVITIVPSVFMAYRIINKSVFEQNVNRFLSNEMKFSQTEIISKKIIFNNDGGLIDVMLGGKHLDSILIDHVKRKLGNYHLSMATLTIRQIYNGNEVVNQYNKMGVSDVLLKKYDEVIDSLERKIKFLENETKFLGLEKLPYTDIIQEALSEHPDIIQFSISPGVFYSLKNDRFDTAYVAYAQFKKKPANEEITRMKSWLQIRIKSESIKLIIN